MLGLALSIANILLLRPLAAITRLLRNQDGTVTLQSLEAVAALPTARNNDGTVTVGAIDAPAATNGYSRPIVILGASNDIGPDDGPNAVLTAEDDDARLRWLDPANGQLRDLDHTLGIPRPGGESFKATTPAISFAKALADADTNDVIYVLVPTAVGGRGISRGGTIDGQGPWHPDGTDPAWDIGGNGPDSQGFGALYNAHVSGNWKNATDAAIADTFPDRTVLPPIFLGHPLNENDADEADYAMLLDATRRCVTGIREAWGYPDAPWVSFGGPPQWTYFGIPNREKITGINAQLAQELPNVAFVDGVEGHQHELEDIHYSNSGCRLLGARMAPAVAVADARTTAPNAWVDWIDRLTNRPDRYVGLYRGLSTYDGPAVRVARRPQ
ncbi:sialate O-acetylesterase [Epibacterium ulvae]|uniref:sialate O-acetylesterase n=1 Tax=Epibacterium ulvae TaxID=1156985 RepID=UPI001BFC144E|nr:sialate O-acetylesterase [Epibacterium ulvae]MBT8152912.1 sialate O-acetylesterase [Epibacterium ulvae]